LQTQSGSNRRPLGVARWTVLVCLLVLAVFATIQVTHVHVNEADPSHCTLCMVQQTAAPVAAMAMAIVMVALGASAPIAEPVAVVRYRRERIFIRPPPRCI